MGEPNISGIQKILDTLNTMKSGALFCLMVLAVITIIYLAWKYWLDYRKQMKIEESKEKRAKDYAKSMQNLSNSIQSHATAENATLEKINGTMETINNTIIKLDTGVDMLIMKASGTINKEDSIKIIRDRFINQVFHSFCTIIEHSLRVNNFERDEDMILVRVKLAMNKDAAMAYEYLRSYNLSIDSSKFFICDQDSKHFLLVDKIWNAIEPLYSSRSSMDQKIEDAFALIENEVIDYVAQCAYENNINMNFRKDRSLATAALVEHTTRLMRRE